MDFLVSFILLSLFFGLVMGVILGFLIWRRGTPSVQAEIDRLGAELARTEAQARELSRAAARLRGEQRTMASVIRFLPTLVRDLNRSDLDRRQIPGFLFQLVETIFEPEQIVFFGVRPGNDEELVLQEHRGLGDVPQGAKRIRIGEGKIGWVAANKVEMLADDWLNLTRTEGRTIADNHPSLRLDMIGPLLHHDQAGDRVLGVLCIGGPTIRPRDEKLMLQMVTNLGSIAIMNTHNVGKLRDQANHDGLTRLLNKRHFMQRLGILVHNAEREAHSLAVFIFDIDNFKHYNDTNGHPAGDEVLRGVAQVLQANLRPGDTPCRYGGEEFVVAMPRASGATALQVAERIRQAVESHPFQHGERQPGGRVTISGGVAVFPVDGTTTTDLILHADQALYQSKAAGRNQVKSYEGVTIGEARTGEQDDWQLDPPSTVEF